MVAQLHAHAMGEEYYIEGLMLENHTHHTEPSVNPGETDIVLTEQYSANNELGSFRWKVTSRLSGLEGSAVIEDTSLISAPERCTVETPRFEIIS